MNSPGPTPAHQPPRVLALLGMPGSGKSTQAARLTLGGATSVHLTKIGVELFLESGVTRNRIGNIGEEPDPVTITQAVLTQVAELMPRVVVLDSFPRTETQSEALVNECRTRRWSLTAIELRLSADESLSRQRERALAGIRTDDTATHQRKIIRALNKDVPAIERLRTLGVDVTTIDATLNVGTVEHLIREAAYENASG